VAFLLKREIISKVCIGIKILWENQKPSDLAMAKRKENRYVKKQLVSVQNSIKRIILNKGGERLEGRTGVK